ncbi:MAG: hypothetical protein V4556_06680 [Bacteroidota bacterium]
MPASLLITFYENYITGRKSYAKGNKTLYNTVYITGFMYIFGNENKACPGKYKE